MPPKTEPTEPKPVQKGTILCGIRSPGPKYKTKTLVGYHEHCLSRYRNPAYTFGRRQIGTLVCEGPGPKYLVQYPRCGGFTFGYAATSFGTFCGPGPKYQPKFPKSSGFAIKSRTGYRRGSDTPGPYSVPRNIEGPYFSIGLRATGASCIGGPGPHSPYDLNIVKPKPPSFTMGYRQTGKIVCDSPGPKYNPKHCISSPKFSFGTKHSECAPPYVVECDDIC